MARTVLVVQMKVVVQNPTTTEMSDLKAVVESESVSFVSDTFGLVFAGQYEVESVTIERSERSA